MTMVNAPTTQTSIQEDLTAPKSKVELATALCAVQTDFPLPWMLYTRWLQPNAGAGRLAQGGGSRCHLRSDLKT